MKTTLETLDVGLANEFKLACRRNFLSEADVKRLCEGDILAQVLRVQQGYAEIVTRQHVIDMDADPFIPKGLELVSHRKQGRLDFDSSKVKLFLAEGQKNGNWMNGKKLQLEVDAQNPYNTNLLDWLLIKENQKFIPVEWRGKTVFFWGTIYRDSRGRLFVRYLYVYGDGSCSSDYFWIVNGFDDNNPAAVAGKS